MDKKVNFSYEKFSCFPKPLRFCKRGSEKYYILISIILGIMILALSLFYIFHEFFTSEELDWESCRQSIVLRNTMPTASRLATVKIEQLKNQFPLKCKTQVINLDWDDKKGSDGDDNYKQNIDFFIKTIADNMAQCWSLVGEGKYNIFPSNIITQKKNCIICARIHFSEEAIKKISPDSTSKYTPLFIREYLATHDINGNLLSTNEINEFMNFEKISKNSLANFLRYSTSDFFIFLDDNNWESGKYGMRFAISPLDGDIFIGSYFYTNNNVELAWPPVVKYSYAYPFFAQVGKDDISSCSIESIPA